MSFVLQESELGPLSLIPDVDLADLAVELDMVPEEVIDRRALLQDAVPRLLALARSEGLPFSKYDRDDLDELPDAHRRALARALGWDDSVDAMLKSGGKVYKSYRRSRKTSQVPLLLPLLLKPLARHADESAGT